MKKYLISFIIVVLIVSNSILLFKTKGIKSLYYTKETEFHNYKFKLHNQQIQDMDLMLQDIGFTIKLPDEPPLYLIYAYSGTECSSCIFEDVELLKEKIKKYNKSNIRIYPVSEDTRNLNIELKTVLYGLDYERLDKGCVQFPRNKNGEHRFFVLRTKDGELRFLFFPNRDLPDRTDTYLEFIFTNYL